MNKNTYEKEKNKWEKSKIKIKELLNKNDTSTINMLNLYKKYINSPYNRTSKAAADVAASA